MHAPGPGPGPARGKQPGPGPGPCIEYICYENMYVCICVYMYVYCPYHSYYPYYPYDPYYSYNPDYPYYAHYSYYSLREPLSSRNLARWPFSQDGDRWPDGPDDHGKMGARWARGTQDVQRIYQNPLGYIVIR